MDNLFKKIKEILLDKAERIEDAFEQGNVENFVKEFQLDAVSKYYIERWFNGYAVKVETPKKVTVDILDIKPVTDNVMWCSTKLCMKYENAFDEEAKFDWKVVWDDENETLRITETVTELKQPDWRNDSIELELTEIKKELERDTVVNDLNKINWDEVTLSRKEAAKKVSASIFSRAVAKSVRYRNTHPQIDSSAILADMMSLRMARFAYKMKDLDEIERLQTINSYANKYYKSKTYDEFKKEGTTEYSPKELSLLPLYSIDETFVQSRKQAITEVSCVDLASFYVGLLRLSGVEGWRAFVVIQPFHYLTVLEHEGKCFVVSTNEVYPMNAKRLYGDTEVVRIVTPTCYIDKGGEATIPEDEYNKIKKIFQNNIPNFLLPEYKEDCSEWPSDMSEILQIQNYSSPEAYHHAIVEFVKQKDRDYPNSIYTWALYSYQLLTVLKPQAYLIWSLHSQDAVKFSKNVESIEMLLTWMKENIEEGSMFEEEERIMTADQVIRNKKGAPKDKGVLFYTIVTLRYPEKEGGVLITEDNSCYVEVKEDGENILYDMSTGETKELKGSKVKLYFNQKKVLRDFVYEQEENNKEC